MNDENSDSRFQFNADRDEPETVLQDELRELKIEKLGQRVTLLTILIPCMIGVILLITYLDIKDRVARTYDTGAIGVQKLSKDLASKFSSLSLEQAKLREIQDKKLPELEKSAAFLKSKLTTLQKSMTQLTASTVNRDELTRVAGSLTDKLADVPQSLKPRFEALAAADRQIIEDARRVSDDIKILADNMAAMNTRIDIVKNEIETLGDKAISKDDLELALKLKEIGYRQSLLDKSGSLEKQIQALGKELDGLRKSISASSAAAPAAAAQPPSTVQQKPAAQGVTQKPATGKPENGPESKPAAAEHGGIVEQTIEQ